MSEQVAALPAKALASYAEVLEVLESMPWNGQSQHPAKPGCARSALGVWHRGVHLLERRRGAYAELAFLSDVRAGRYTLIESLSVDLKRGRHAADPFVIGLARAHIGIVVTEETPTSNLERPRIPDVCSALGVRCVNLIGFIRDQGWTF